MEQREFLISFGDASVADANYYSDDLRSQLLDADPTVTIERRRPNSTTMDFGATLAMVLGAPATIALAKAVIAWAQRHERVRIVVKTDKGSVIAENLESKDAADIVKALS